MASRNFVERLFLWQRMHHKSRRLVTVIVKEKHDLTMQLDGCTNIGKFLARVLSGHGDSKQVAREPNPRRTGTKEELKWRRRHNTQHNRRHDPPQQNPPMDHQNHPGNKAEHGNQTCFAQAADRQSVTTSSGNLDAYTGWHPQEGDSGPCNPPPRWSRRPSGTQLICPRECGKPTCALTPSCTAL